MCHIDIIRKSVFINGPISCLLAASDESNEFVTTTFSLWIWSEKKNLNNQLH